MREGAMGSTKLHVVDFIRITKCIRCIVEVILIKDIIRGFLKVVLMGCIARGLPIVVGSTGGSCGEQVNPEVSWGQVKVVGKALMTVI